MKKNITELMVEINERFDHYIVSEEKAYAKAGKKTAKQLEIENSEQFDSRRELLTVEEKANKKREQAERKKEVFNSKIEKEFHREISLELQTRLTDTDDIMSSVLNLDPRIGKLIDILYTEACTISRLVSEIEHMPWLSKSVIRFTHQPKYQRTDASGSAIIIKTLRQALCFIGIESLKTLIPVLIAKHVLPNTSESFKDLRKHLWLYTIGSANVAKCLAPRMGLREEFGFIAGMMSTIGTTAVLTNYRKVFDAKQREAIIKCRESNVRQKEQALSELTYSQEYLSAYMTKYAAKITAGIVSRFKMKWIMVTPGFEDLKSITNQTFKEIHKQDLHPIAQLLFKSQGFMKFKLLQSSSLLSREESMLWLHNCGINGDDIAILSLINLTGVTLEVAEDIVSES